MSDQGEHAPRAADETVPEPVIIAATTVTAVTATLPTLVLLNVIHLSADQIAGIGLALTAILNVPLAFFVRGKVRAL